MCNFEKHQVSIFTLSKHLGIIIAHRHESVLNNQLEIIMLKLDLKRQPDGNFEDILITCPEGGEIRIHIAGINPNKIRTSIDAPRAIMIGRASHGDFNIHDEIRRLAPNLNKNFKDGDLYFSGNSYPTKERVRINSSGAIVLVADSKIGEHFAKILRDKGVPFKIDQEKYLCYNATNLKKAGLIP